MKLNKFLTLTMIASAGMFVSCNEEDNPVPLPKTGEVIVICNGQMSNSIPGSITLYNPKDDSVINGAFSLANGRYIGSSVESATAGPDHTLYLISTSENTIEIVNESNMISKGTINMVSLFGEKGDKPRYAAYYNGYLYVTTYAGYVCPININTLKGKDPIAVGSYPEDIQITTETFDQSKVYAWVANSDYGNVTNASISKINLTTSTVEETIKAPEIKNPSKIIAGDGCIWFLDRGSYDSNWNQVGSALYKYDFKSKAFTKIADATMISNTDGTHVAICNAPWQTPPVTPKYALIDLTTGSVKDIPDVKVDYPAFLGLDSLSSELYIGSYTTNPETGYANYNQFGYVQIYNYQGEALRRFTCGVGPMDIFFTTKW